MKIPLLFIASMLTGFLLFLGAEYATLSAQTAKLTAPQTVYGRDFFEVIEGDGKRRYVELHTSSGIGRQVPLYQPPSAGAQCNVGKFGTAGEYLYVCRPIDGAGVIGLWARTKLETVW